MKPMEYRKIARWLSAAGCTHVRTKGSHHVWKCPCGQHTAAIAPQKKGIVSAGVVRDTIKKMACIQKGPQQ